MVIKVSKPNWPEWTFMVRGVSSGNTIEKIYPFSYSKFAKIVLVDEYKVRRAKLFYIRNKVWKWAKFKSKILSEKRNSELFVVKK